MGLFSQYVAKPADAIESRIGPLEIGEAHQLGHQGHAMPPHYRHTPKLAAAWAAGYREFQRSGPPRQQFRRI